MNFQNNNDKNKTNPNSWQSKIDPATGGWKRDSNPGGYQRGSSGNTNEAAPVSKQSVVSLPKGGGAIRGMGEKFEANPVTGTGSFSVPLAISPGRSGFTPQLALSYDSGSGSTPFGLGWNIGIPCISRKTDKGLPQYNDNPAQESDVFLLSGAEDLVPVLKYENNEWVRDLRTESNYMIYSYRPRTEGLFALIERWVDNDGISHWRSITKDNITSIYGQTHIEDQNQVVEKTTRIYDPSDKRKIFTWMLEKSWDAKGNLMEFEYKKEDNVNVGNEVFEHNRLASAQCFTNLYLKQVRYGNTEMYSPTNSNYTTNWLFRLVFDYGDHPGSNPGLAPTHDWACRQDAFSMYKAVFEIRTFRLCQRILMFHQFTELDINNPVLVRSTDLTHNENEYLSTVASIKHTSYNYQEQTSDSLPAIEFTYSEATIGQKIYPVKPDMLRNMPDGVDGTKYQWADLNSEGISGILRMDNQAWYFAPNYGDKNYYQPTTNPEPELVLGGMRPVAQKPSAINSKSSSFHLGDVDGDGLPEVVVNAPGINGYYSRDEDGAWKPFRTFTQMPNINLSDPNIRMIDLTGDGLADILIGRGDYFAIYFSEGKAGYGRFRRVECASNEEKGPRAVFSDEGRRIYLADMSGDGLQDIVRITNGSVCYWPNMGYGRFGEKVVMKNAPRFDNTGAYNPSQLRLADVDGTGTSDIIYLGSSGVRYWKNQAGNAWSEAFQITGFPLADKATVVEVTDLMGNGTSCMVWSTSLPGKPCHMRYMELTSGVKPYLLTEIKNNMGGITRMQYAPSTKFYLNDKRKGKPWITRLPFPVHVLERVETRDEAAGNVFVNLYAYHHGYYDHTEREFRGFGMVEQWDTEQFSVMQTAGYGVEETNINESSHVPPVYTKTWFHTGFFKRRSGISTQFKNEYFNGDEYAWYLDDTILPAGLNSQEAREACRAMRGSVLRREVYAQDNTNSAALPYTVEEKSYNIRCLQPQSTNKHAVFHVTEAETIAYHYERNTTDPRILHSLVLETDIYGNVKKSAQVAYPRRIVPQDLLLEQGKMPVVYTENSFINETHNDWRLIGVNCETQAYELTGIVFSANTKLTIDGMLTDIGNATEIDYAANPSTTTPTPKEKRKIQNDRVYFCDEDGESGLALGRISPQALPYQQLSMAYTEALITKMRTYNNTSPAGNEMLSDYSTTNIIIDILTYEGNFIDKDSDSNLWRIKEQFAYDNDKFYLVKSKADPMGNTSTISYDAHKLLIESFTDPQTHTINVTNNYRLLQPYMIEDINHNFTSVTFDTLGMVTEMSLMGKLVNSVYEGDVPGNPTIAYIYNLHNWTLSPHQPNYVRVFMREKHGSNNATQWAGVNPANPGANAGWLESITYTGGLGNELMTKTQAELGHALHINIVSLLNVLSNPYNSQNNNNLPEGQELRWVVNGRTVLNNKGKVAVQYEPYFTHTNAWDNYHLASNADSFIEKTVFSYDPLLRVIRTDYADGTFSKVVFDAWKQENWDQNDTCSDSQWYLDNGSPDPNDPEPALGLITTITDEERMERAAWLSMHHKNTPQIIDFDTLGRAFRTSDNDGNNHIVITKLTLDITGNTISMTDALNREATVNCYNILKEPVYTNNIDSGKRWMLNNAAGLPLRSWDNLGNEMQYTYDSLLQPLKTKLLIKDQGQTVSKTVTNIEYGISPGDNSIGKPVLICDQSGKTEIVTYDFKGNVLVQHKTLLSEYKNYVDWDSDPIPVFAQGTFIQSFEFDAMSRPVQVTQPDESVVKYTYNKAGLLETIQSQLRGDTNWTDFITNINYNEKGQRTDVYYGNGSKTGYEYDKKTFRLNRILTTRNSGANNLQDLKYFYDAVGNIVEVYDLAQQTIYFSNCGVEPKGQYRYDALNRLIKSTGRELNGLAMPSSDDILNEIPIPDTSSGAMQQYTEYYFYDALGNIGQLQHYCGQTPNWTRNYVYDNDNNRLLRHIQVQTPDDYTYDAHGNMTKMPNLPVMDWDYANRLKKTTCGNVNTWYCYDVNGERVRKVTEKQGGIREERIYMNGFEVFRTYSGESLNLERQSLNILDIKLPEKGEEENQQGTKYSFDYNKKIAIIETLTIEDEEVPSPIVATIRYQYSYHLGSACLELDGSANIISYEEYHSFGTTSYRSGRNSVDVSLKRYKYIGKERDEETGLYYYGARYYAAWLCRFVSVDPLQHKYPHYTPYQYAGNKPINYIDLDGREPAESGGKKGDYGDAFKKGTNEYHIWEWKGDKWIDAGVSLKPVTITGNKYCGVGSVWVANGKRYTWNTSNTMTVEPYPNVNQENPEFKFIIPQNFGEYGQPGSDGLIWKGCMSCHAENGAYHYAAYNSQERIFGQLIASFTLMFVGPEIGIINQEKAAKTGTSLWPAASGGRTVINGIEYTTHALERMQPVGTIIKGTEMFSRGVTPSVVENAIKFGKITPGNSAAEVVRTFENVRVITNPAGTKVISVIKFGH